MTLLTKLALPVVLVAILILLATGNFVSNSPWVCAAQVLAIALAIWARTVFRTGQFSVQAEPHNGPLLSNGPYRLIRHPMYAAALLLIVSTVAGHVSLFTLGVGLVVIFFVGLRIMIEEKALHKHFAEYATYARSTKRIIPFVL